MNIDDLRQCGELNFFGLGFLQLKVSETERYHFWHTMTQTDEYVDEWHDHRYDFNSQVIVGSITNEIAYYVDDPDGTDIRLQVCCAGNPPIFGSRCNLIHLGEFHTTEGHGYTLRNDTLHKARSQFAMTRLVRGPIVKDRANVVAPEHKSPNPFQAYMSKSQMWEIVEDIVGKQGYHTSYIPKGTLGELSKIREELLELEDAARQGVVIMELVELSDLIGAISLYLEGHHPSIGVDDLIKMSEVTKRAFRNGTRT